MKELTLCILLVLGAMGCVRDALQRSDKSTNVLECTHVDVLGVPIEYDNGLVGYIHGDTVYVPMDQQDARMWDFFRTTKAYLMSFRGEGPDMSYMESDPVYVTTNAILLYDPTAYGVCVTNAIEEL